MVIPSEAPTLRVVDVHAAHRPVVLRQPFRFGVLTLTECPQVFVRARVRCADGCEAEGIAAEMLLPKWFDKSPELSGDDNIRQLETALALAAQSYLAVDQDLTAFGLHAYCAAAHEDRGAAAGLNALTANYGTAILDRAVIDAVGKLLGLPAAALVRRNLLGIDAATTPDLQGFDLDGFLAARRLPDTIDARHTVGMVDAITDDELNEETRVDDGLPQSLEACARFYGCTHFKLKVGGNLDADLQRLRAIAGVLDALPQDYRCSLDGNEQYATPGDFSKLLDAIAADERLANLWRSILFIEQPIARAHALERPLGPLGERVPIIIDESDATIDSFRRALALGYRGVSSKQCKGVYRSLLNAARVANANAQSGGDTYLMSGEDLVIQAGIALQQDLILAGLVGCTHLERNGHHYVNGLAAVPQAEQEAFLDAHPRLYHRQDGVVRLRIDGGQIDLCDLHDQPGLGSGAQPDWSAMTAIDLASCSSLS